MATAMQPPVDFAGSMERVALLLCGNLNDRMSKGNRLRFGTHGSMEVDVAEGYPIDLDADPEGVAFQSAYWFGLFSHQRATLRWKGIVTIRLEDDDAAAIADLARRTAAWL